MNRLLLPFLPLAAALPAAAAPAMQNAAPANSAPRIALWKGDAKGAVSLYYDDGTESSFSFVRPSLLEHGLPGTFYICCGWFGGEEDPKLARWGKAFREDPGIEPGNHTWSHGGVTNAAHLAEEAGRNDALLRKLAGWPAERLMTFAYPGAVGWKVSKEEEKACFAALHECVRHDFAQNIFGPADRADFPVHTFADALPILDRAEATGSWEPLLFHGVGGDWLVFPAEDHAKLVEELAARAAAGRLWVGSAADVEKYRTEREGASIERVKDDGRGGGVFRVRIPAASETFDLPLTALVPAPDGAVGAVVEGRGGFAVTNGFAVIEVGGRSPGGAVSATDEFDLLFAFGE